MKLKLRDSLTTPDKKREFNKELFGGIAANYDRVNDLLSFWRDRAWKRDLIHSLPPLGRPRCLDIACGTGDLCERLAAKYPDAEIVGLDLTEEMLAIARTRVRGPRVTFREGDMCRMDFPDGSFDVVTGGYALRNAPDLKQALAEIRRVLKPGGMAAFMDFSKPPSKLFQCLEIGALAAWSGICGLLLGKPKEYGYIVASLRQFPDREALHKLLEENGFTDIQSRLFFLGVIECVTFRKTGTP
jgi:demethylmenaquinone methyltransferase/2-methoxy-6-polyprenyl-1,4-benzoquinol methylase